MTNEEAINVLHGIRADNLNLDDAYTKDKYDALGMAIEALSEQRTGHWIQISPAQIYECSECGQNVMTSDICAYMYCHGCGVKMEVIE